MVDDLPTLPLLPIASCLLPLLCSRLDAVAHGGNPQDRAASLLPAPCSLKPRYLYLTSRRIAICPTTYQKC
ncbi:hypothetical protein [Moorena sp. SIO3H5]|uniref:hypothetical protein n=1 Tax=Moorena sp. SIO3H5 TaxID=2607834 RepID=UPI0013B8F6A0|nr:hypothetical protein [Moorena sp. SIO3H5]NEO72043.1 hypothetical protein [Moorena sp. SIO3H5]